MSSLTAAWDQVKAGATVTIRPRGHSMTGLVDDGATVEVAPCVAGRLEAGDVVLVRVSGRVYLHKVLLADTAGRVRIGNNKGGVNGWAGLDKVAGIAVSVNGTARPRLRDKVAPAGD